MTMRLLLVLALALALAAAPAHAQDGPFGPVPTPVPTIEPIPGGPDDDVGRSTLYLIAGGVLIGVLAIGYAISRDARRSLTDTDRETLEREESGLPAQDRPAKDLSREAKARAAKQRKKEKAARQARKHNRPR